MKYQYLTIMIVATIFGLMGGSVGFLAARTFILGSEFNLPLFGDIDLDNAGGGNASIIIRNPRNIVIEQDKKVVETKEAVKRSLFAIYEYEQKEATSSILRDGSNLIGENSEIGQAFAITSDGWLISAFIPGEAINYSRQSTSTQNKILNNIKDSYLIGDKERNFYPIEDLQISGKALAYWKIKANDIAVRNMTGIDAIDNGQILMAVNWDECISLLSVVNKDSCEQEIIESSDKADFTISFDKTLSDDFYGGFIFNFYGDLIAIMDSGGKVLPYDLLAGEIKGILDKNKIVFPQLRLKYIDLSRFFIPESEYEKGAYVISFSNNNAEDETILPGDIITHVNDIELNKQNRLNRLINQKLPGEMIDIRLLRDNKEKQISVILN